MPEQLLNDWDNRPSAFFEPNKVNRVRKEIVLLKALRAKGCEKTNDGLSIKVQLDDRTALLLEISKKPAKNDDP